MKRLNPTEKKAALYLKSKGVVLDTANLLLKHRPDFVDIDGNEYEIKRIVSNYKNRSACIFRKIQIRKFDDKTNVLMFRPFEEKPEIETTMKEIRKMMTLPRKGNFGNKNIKGVRIEIK